MERSTLFDSVGYLRGLWFPPSLQIAQYILLERMLSKIKLTLGSRFNIFKGEAAAQPEDKLELRKYQDKTIPRDLCQFKV
jgi:hypothetical protein